MASLHHLVETSEWPGVNPKAFWSLCERIPDLFTLDVSDECRAEYTFHNEVDGKLLKAPFDGLYNLFIESWPSAEIEKATLYFNGTPIEVCEGPDVQFETFHEENPLPIGLCDGGELRIVLKFNAPAYVPKSIGSARLMRFRWKNKNEPFVITTSCNCAMMYDGQQIRAVSYIEEEGTDEGLKTLVEQITGSTPDPARLKQLFDGT